MALSFVSVYAAQPREIQYAHALSRAISRNPSIPPLDRDARQANARARDLWYEYVNLANSDDEQAGVVYGQRLMAIAESNRAQRERERLVLSAELSLRRHLSNISGFESDLTMLENSISLQERMLEQTELRHYHGMASEMDLRDAQHALEQSNLNLDMLRLNLENERYQLNRLIHQPITANIQVIYDVHDIEPIPQDAGTERFMRFQVERDHNLQRWLDEVSIRHHEWQRQLDDPEVDNRYMRLQHQLAVLERNLARQQAELSIRNALAEWDRLIEQEAALYAEVAQARADYENMLNRFEAGMVTQIQVDQLGLALAQAEARLVRHAYAFWIARLRVEHPYMR